MSIGDDLKKLPPQALDVLRFLDGQAHAAAEAIRDATGLSERGFGKAIRALITRRYAVMPEQGVYTLSERGREAADLLPADGRAADAPAPTAESAPPTPPDAAEPAPSEKSAPPPVPAARPEAPPAAPKAPPAPEAPPQRRLSVLVAREFTRHLPARLMIGFDAAPDDAPAPAGRTLVLRVSAEGCTVEPAEQTLDIPPRRPAGPAQFRIVSHEGDRVRVRVEVFEAGAPLGGLYFDVPVTELPTPGSAAFHALGATITLPPEGPATPP